MLEQIIYKMFQEKADLLLNIFRKTQLTKKTPKSKKVHFLTGNCLFGSSFSLILNR